MKQIFVMMAAVVLVGCGKDNPDDLIPVRVVSSAEIANELFVEAVALIARADNTNGLVAVDLYEQGLGKVREIVGDHSKTDLAVKIVNGQTVFTNREFDRIVTRMENLKSGEVKFGDPGIEKTVRSLINKPRGVIYGAEVTGIINLATDPRGYQHFNVTEAGLKDVAKLPNLKELRIRDSEELTAEGLKELAKLQKLTSLNLESPRITDEGLKELAKLQELKELNLSYTKTTDAGVAELKKALPNCKISYTLINDRDLQNKINSTLSKGYNAEITKADLEKITALNFKNQDITVRGALEELAKFQNLKELVLKDTKITDAGLKEVAKLQQLERLSLWGTKITDEGLKDVAKLQQLEGLLLGNSQITDAGLKELAKLQKLEILDLSRTQITDAGLKEVVKLQKLQTLVLNYTQITDAGLKELAKMQNLKELDLEFAKFTKGGVTELKKALPNCTIYPR
ncbi:MAG: leucine-rich repeat domain-containing protein [Limisphaerales bacterium]